MAEKSFHKLDKWILELKLIIELVIILGPCSQRPMVGILIDTFRLELSVFIEYIKNQKGYILPLS